MNDSYSERKPFNRDAITPTPPRPALTLVEYFEKTEARRNLVENLQANMDAMGISKLDQSGLLRVNLIMIRQAMQAEGVE